MKGFIFKHIQTIGLIAIMLISMISCRRGNTTRISTTDEHNTQTIEYSGRVVFSKDQRGIADIARNGHVKFARNDKTMEAELGKNGKVVYGFNGDSPVEKLTDEQKQFVAEAVQTIIRERNKLRTSRN